VPREISLVSPVPVTLPVLVEAAVAVDGGLVPRRIFGGWAMQLVDGHDVAVLTIELSHRVEDTFDIVRLTRLSGVPDQLGPSRAGAGEGEVPRELWWTEATAPWGRAGEPGVDIVRGLGELIGARILVEEGR
jgi:hypothetical protein